MDFNWNDYIVIKDGISKEISEEKKMQSVNTVTNILMTSWFTGIDYSELLESFGFDENGKKDSSESTAKNIEQSKRLLAQVFEED